MLSAGLSVNEFSCLRSVGFEPIGQVSGARSSICRGAALLDMRRCALDKLAEECAALGGHGVTAVRFSITPFAVGGDPQNTHQVTAYGTAVRARGCEAPAQVFRSMVPGQEFAAPLSSGWMPVDIVIGATVGLRHELTEGWWKYSPLNYEIGGWPEVISAVQRDAHERLIADIARTGADGAILANAETSPDAFPCGYGGYHHASTTVLMATAITYRSARASPDLGIAPAMSMDSAPTT